MMLRRLAASLSALALAAFFAFVGWNKAFASLADLARYNAWTIHLSEWAGRIVGWSEMAMAAGLLGAFVRSGRGLARASAALLIANQIVAAATHAAHDEMNALPQNGVLIALLGAVVLLLRSSTTGTAKEERV